MMISMYISSFLYIDSIYSYNAYVKEKIKKPAQKRTGFCDAPFDLRFHDFQ